MFDGSTFHPPGNDDDDDPPEEFADDEPDQEADDPPRSWFWPGLLVGIVVLFLLH